MEQEPSQTSFSNSAAKSRSIKKMKKYLLQSPQKKKEKIKSLASKFNVKVKLGQKIGRKKNVLSEQENQCLFAFLSRPNISFTASGRRDDIYLEKFIKVKRFT